MEKKEIKKYLLIAVLAVAVCVVVQNFDIVKDIIKIALAALKPLFIGCVMAYIFNIIMNSFEKRYFPNQKTGFINTSRRPVCLILSFAIAIAVIMLILYIIIPEMVNAIKLMYTALPPIFVKYKDLAVDKLKEYPDIQKELASIEIDTAAIAENVTSGAYSLFSSAITFIGAVTSAVTNMVIGLIFAIYLLLRKDKLVNDIRRVMAATLSEKYIRRVNRFCSVAHETFTNFFIGQFIEAIIIGTLTFIGASILKLPYAAMTGTIVGVTALIPIVGAFVGAGLSAFIIFTESPQQAVVFLIFLVVLQQFETNIIYPKVVGSSIGLPGIWVLASVTLGGGLFGVLGMMIGVPLAATIYKLGFAKLERRETELGIEIPLEEEKNTPVRKQKSEPVKSVKRLKSKKK